jgi:acetyl-CoA carboxylase carboxyltransferase component
VELCCQRKIPLLFLQNITGELLGVKLVVKDITGFVC